MKLKPIALLLLFVLPPLFCAEEQSQKEKELDVITYGLDSDIVALLGTLVSEKRYDYTPEILALSKDAKTTAVKEAVIRYFTAAQDTGLADQALSVAADPYDEPNSTVLLVLKYIGAIKLTAAVPSVRALFDRETNEYFDAACDALAAIGGEEDAQFLADFFDRDDLAAPQRQSLMRALGKLKADSTLDKLSEIADNEDESITIRSSAVAAIGDLGHKDSESLLLRLYNNPNSLFRAAIVGALANFDTADSRSLIQQAIRDENYRVRLAAVEAAKKLKLTDAMPFLLARAKNDPEASIKYAAYDAIAALGTQEGADFLISILADSKSSDTALVRAAAALLSDDTASRSRSAAIDAITELARKVVKDDRRKPLRYALGRELAKHGDPGLAEICRLYLASGDVSTKGTGLDMFATGKFDSARPDVQAIADDEKAGANRQKARRILGLE
ncbi:MAG: HEAT repeat domain-containing protein [Treponema sp.]|nr:HEAT repeat domain-containing protein [Treponema sp.]